MFIPAIFNAIKGTNIIPRSWNAMINISSIHSSSCLYKKRKRLTEAVVPELSPENNGHNLCKSKMNFRCKVALVVGGTSGIGFATASELISAGCQHVIVSGLDAAKCNKTVKMLNGTYGKDKASYISFDVCDQRRYEAALQCILDTHCHLDILVNCVGIFNGQKWEQEIDTNVVGVIRGTLLGYDYMGLDSVGHGGVIVNVAGTMGLEPMPGAATFSASKHAVVGFSRSYGTEANEAVTGVRLATLCPGITYTDMLRRVPHKAMAKMELVLERDIEKAKKQRAECCAKSVIHLIKFADTGSVWVIEGAQLFEANIPDRHTYSSLTTNYL